MKLQFRTVATAIALIFSALALVLMCAPHLVVATWGLDVTLSVTVMCRRVAVLFAGIAVMLFSARNAEPSVARSALVKGVMAISVLLAALGLFELKMGNVTPGILTAVVIEVVVLLAFVLIGRSPTAFNERPER